MAESYDFARFVKAQERVYGSVTVDLRAGRKSGHWMWFVFPQLRGLGRSSMSHEYGLASINEAKAYLQHEVLGVRLRECTQLVLAVERRTALDIFGSPDDMKLRSCMTLFSLAEGDGSCFQAALAKYFDGQPDELTLQLLGLSPRG